MYITVLFILVILHKAKADDCYWKSPDRWVLTDRGKELRELNKRECRVNTAQSTDYFLCISTLVYRLKVCRCIALNVSATSLDRLCDEELKAEYCSEYCKAEKICANNGTLYLNYCEDNVSVEQKISCSCPSDDFRGNECGEVKELRLCGVRKDKEVNLPLCESNTTTPNDVTCLYSSHGNTYRCTDTIAGVKVIDIQESPLESCSQHAEKRTKNNTLGNQGASSKTGVDGDTTERLKWIIPVVIGVLALAIVILLLLVKHYKRKALERRDTQADGQDETHAMNIEDVRII